jgi:putative endonuclease
MAASTWLVYILRCADGSLYTGCTNDIERRLRCHSRKQVKYTRGRLPVEVLYKEPVAGHGAALHREAAIKKLRRSQKLALGKRYDSLASPRQ